MDDGVGVHTTKTEEADTEVQYNFNEAGKDTLGRVYI